MAASVPPAFARGPVNEIGARLAIGALIAVLAQEPGRAAAISETDGDRSGICPASGVAFHTTASGVSEYDLLSAVGYARIAEAFEIGGDIAPIQIRSTVPYVLAGVVSPVLKQRPAEVVARMTSGIPFLVTRAQIVGVVAGCLRHVGGLNARCASGELPEAAAVDLGAFLGMRLAADRATDRGLLLSRIDNAILSALHGSDIRRSAGGISEWIGACIDEHHLPSAIEAAIGTLAWRGFVAHERDASAIRYRLTEAGLGALRTEAAKIAALHAHLKGLAA